MSTKPHPYRLRTKLSASSLQIILGPADSGPDARSADQVIANTPHRRLLEGLADGMVSALANGVSAQLIRAIDGTVARPALSLKEVARRQHELDELASQLEELDAALDTATETVRSILTEERSKLRRRADRIAEAIKAATNQPREPKSRQPVQVEDLLEGLAEIVRDGAGAEALSDLLHDLHPVEINEIHLRFRTHLALPTPDGELVLLGPIEFTTENTSRRVSNKVRDGAIARLCLRRAWPVAITAAGVPLVTPVRGRTQVASALSRELRPLVGSKAASILGGCEAPEVLAVIARQFKFGDPEVQVDLDLEKRIRETYFASRPPGPKAWIGVKSGSPLAELVLQIHQEGSVDVNSGAGVHGYWEKQGALERKGGELVRQRCACGSEDLGLIPVPEIRGLVCLACRTDRSGLSIPTTWNAALANPEYWEALGYDTTIPPMPGLPANPLGLEPLRMKPTAGD